jgi:hypothetical protein
VPTTECIPQTQFGFHPDLLIIAKADGESISSDGGALLLRAVDDRIGLSGWFAACLKDERDPDRTEHDRLEQTRQRVYQIALGYEDCNDADRLRHDPILKTACDRLPDAEDGLSSQPTLSRFENAVDGYVLKALVDRFEQSFVDELPDDTSLVVLDIDPTDMETHGGQQLTFVHGFYDHYMYHPLLVFDAVTGQLATVLLRPGNTHASRGAIPVLRRLARRIKARFPLAQIVVRGDSGFCIPRLLEALEALDRELGDVDYVIGIAKNPRLLAMAAAQMAEAERRFEETRRHVRLFSWIRYAAETWSEKRSVVVKAEHHDRGANPRFVVTTLDGFPPQPVYDAVYCARGQCENLIKEFKNALQAERLSCSRYVANFFRLLLHAAAYRLMHALRTVVAIADPDVGRRQFDTLRLALLKVAAEVQRSARRILVRLPRAFPLAELFCRLPALLVADTLRPAPS